MDIKIRICCICNQELPATAEYFYKKDKWLMRSCKPCNNIKQAKQDEKNKAKKRKDNPNTSKKCTMCQESFPATLEHFKSNGIYLSSRCRACSRLKDKEWADKNREQKRQADRDYCRKNREKNIQRVLEWQKNNPERTNLKRKSWLDNNPEKKEAAYKRIKEWTKENSGKCRAKFARYRAAKKGATPVWADIEAIKKFYIEAEYLTRTTEIEHSVDHIDPLQSKIVCGMHTENNLQVITLYRNQSKGNRFKPYRIDTNGIFYELSGEDWVERPSKFVKSAFTFNLSNQDATQSNTQSEHTHS